VIDGRVVGRGTADMKGSLAAFVAALEAVTACDRPRGDVIVESVIEEETGGNGTLAAVLRGYRADGAIVGEPTSLDVIVGHQGSLWFRIHVPGRASHAAYKWKGVSAIEKAMVVYQALMDLEREREPLCTSDMFKDYEVRTPVSIGVLRAGDWPATIPDLAELEGRIGVLPGETLDEVRRAVEARVAAAAAGGPLPARAAAIRGMARHSHRARGDRPGPSACSAH
jgi:acetylornithine deacetylase